MRRAFPRSEYLHTHEWIREWLKAWFRLPWLPEPLGFICVGTMIMVVGSITTDAHA